MIILITCRDENRKIVVSHGIDADTLKTVILPCEELNYFRIHCKAYFLPSIGEWVMEDSNDG